MLSHSFPIAKASQQQLALPVPHVLSTPPGRFLPGIVSGCRLLLVASRGAEVAAVRSSRDLPGLASFEHEALRAARRKRAALPVLGPPVGELLF